MRHRKHKGKLGRDSSHQKALMQNLAKSLIQYELIQTTEAKAKRLRSYIDRLVTLGKKGTLHHRRQALATLGNDNTAVRKLFDDIAKRDTIANRPGGYTRIIKLANREGDNAPVVRISFVGSTIENTEALRRPAHIREQIEEVEVDYSANEATE